jgi:prepilin-type N-terminal cleavage/methylation domain-containing protein
MMKHFNNSNGFSLIEILAAMAILSIALLGLASLMVSTTRNNASGMQMAEAVNLAQNMIENLSAGKWADMLPGTDKPKGFNGIEYTRTWAFSPDIVGDTGRVRPVTVTITWKDKVDHSISIQSGIYYQVAE